MPFFLFLISLLANQAQAAPQPIVLGVHSKTPPLEWRENGVDQGFNIELFGRIGEILNRPVQVRRKTFQQLIQDVQDYEQNIDVIAVVSPVGIPRTNKQSDPIYATHAKAYARDSDTLIQGWESLKDKIVAVKTGSFIDVFLQNKPHNFTRVDVDLYETGFELMRDGIVDVVLAENFVARRLQPNFPAIRSVSDPLIYGTFNFITQDSQGPLMNEINTALRQLKRTGEYDQLVNKWFGIGREKVDLLSTQRQIMWWAIAVALISMVGMLLTWGISRRLHLQGKELIQELTQRRQAENELSKLSRQFQSVLDGIPHGIYLYNAQFDCLWSNRKHSQIINQNQSELFSALGQVLKDSLTYQNYIHRAGHHWQVQLHNIGNEQAVALVQDTTEQQRLRQANEQASRLASLGELSAGIAHEINNPTGLIVHAVALLRDALPDLAPAITRHQQYDPFWHIAGLPAEDALQELNYGANNIDDAVQRIARIVNDLKQYAQPEQQQQLQSVCLNDCVTVALRLTANQVKRFQLSLELSEQAPILKGAPQQLQQVLINLIQNACLAMSNDSGLLVIRTGIEHASDAVERCFVEIQDNGCGMDNATLSRIKEPFFTTRRASGGTGLGLSVCSRIIAAHNGEWLIDSTPQQGTRVLVSFPGDKN